MPGAVLSVSYHTPLKKLHKKRNVHIWGLIGTVESYGRQEKGGCPLKNLSVAQPIVRGPGSQPKCLA